MEHASEAVPGAKFISGLLLLPPEVYEIVLIKLHYDKRAICSLVSVNRHFYHHLGTYRFRDVVIRLGLEFSTSPAKVSKTTLGKRFKRHNLSKHDEPARPTSEVILQPPMHNEVLNSLHDLISKPNMQHNLRAIRSVTIKEGLFTGLTAMRCPDDDRLKNQWHLIKSILEQAVHLKTFIYDCGLRFPVEFLTFLETEKPLVRLEMLKWYQYYCDDAEVHNPFLSALAKSSSLRTITLGGEQCYHSPASVWFFRRIIKAAPNLKIIRYGSDLNPRGPRTRTFCRDPAGWAIAAENNQKLRARFNATLPCIKPIEELKIAKLLSEGDLVFPFSNTWESFLDFSKLRILDLTAPGIRIEFEKLCNSNPFTNLKKLSFTYKNEQNGGVLGPQEAIYMFLDSCSLEALAVFSSFPFDIDCLLGAQTDTLSFLLIEWYPTPADLYFIRDHCRSLEFLSISARLPHEDTKVCSALVTLEQLRCLRIRISTLSMGCASLSDVGNGSISDEDWEEVMLAVQDDVNPNEDAIFLVWKFIALKWRGKRLPKTAIRGSYHLRDQRRYTYLGDCEAFWVIEPKGEACPGSADADFYRGFDLVGFENYKVASFPDAELDYPKIPMPYQDRVER